MLCFNPVLKQSEVLFKPELSIVDIGDLSSEYLAIPLTPGSPAPLDNNFHCSEFWQ